MAGGVGNGSMSNASIVLWILGAVMAVAMALATYNLNTMTDRVQALEGTASSNRERISALEARYMTIESTLIRIESKLDRHVLPGAE